MTTFLHLKLFLIVCLVSLLTAHGQDSFFIKDVNVFDGDIYIEKINVLINAEKITGVGEDVKPLKNSLIIEGKGKTLMPALSNAHVHAWSPEVLKEAAEAGVLNVMDMHGIEKFQAMLKKLNDSTHYATYYIAGAAATVPEGHGTQFGFPTPTLSKPEEASNFVSKRVEAGADYIKIIIEPSMPSLLSDTVTALVDEAHKADKMAVVHVSRLEDAVAVLNNKADGLVHIWWDTPIEMNELQVLVSENSFFVIPTLLTTLKALQSIGDNANTYMSEEKLKAEVLKLYKAGIPILAGTDPPNLGINYGDDLYKELQLLKSAGLPSVEVLKTATSNVADAFKLTNKGYVKPGFQADLILIDGNPLEDLNRLNFIQTIWKQGNILK